MIRASARIFAKYMVSVEANDRGLCTIVVSGGGRAHVRFSNVYSHIEQALRDAETLARLTMESWGLPFYGELKWIREPPRIVAISSTVAG